MLRSLLPSPAFGSAFRGAFPSTFVQCRFVGRRDERSAWKQKPNKKPTVAVILLQDVEGFGDKHTEILVRPGEARNQLIPQKLADYANYVTRQKYGVEKRIEKKTPNLKEMTLEEKEDSLFEARNLAHVYLRKWYRTAIVRRTRTFRIMPSDIVAAYYRMYKFLIPLTSVYLKKPIKTFGEHLVPVKVFDPERDDHVQVGVIVHVTTNKEIREAKGIAAVQRKRNLQRKELKRPLTIVGGVFDRVQDLEDMRLQQAIDRKEAFIRRREAKRRARGLDETSSSSSPLADTASGEWSSKVDTGSPKEIVDLDALDNEGVSSAAADNSSEKTDPVSDRTSSDEWGMPDTVDWTNSSDPNGETKTS